jgi:hypothetical protein
MPPPNLYARAQHSSATIAHETAGAARAAGSRSRIQIYQRHCERSEAIHRSTSRKNGLLRCARNDGGESAAGCLKFEWTCSKLVVVPANAGTHTSRPWVRARCWPPRLIDKSRAMDPCFRRDDGKPRHDEVRLGRDAGPSFAAISTLHGVVFAILCLGPPEQPDRLCRRLRRIESTPTHQAQFCFFRLVAAAASTTLSTSSRQLRISAASTG